MAEKVSAIEEGLDTDDIVTYICILLKKRNSKPQLVQKLKVFFNERTEEFVDSLSVQKKSARCRFWPDCSNGDSCEFFHPTQEVSFT